MTALARIEGRRVETKLSAEPFMDDEEAQRRLSATIGSERLRHAVLQTMGIDPGPFNLPKIVRPIIKIDVREPHAPVADIQRAVAGYYKIDVIHMKSARRSRKLSHPRQVAMYLASELTEASLVQIGRLFGNRDHTTVIHAIRAVKERIHSDTQTAADVEALRDAIEA